MLNKIFQIWNVPEKKEIRDYIENIYISHKNILKIMEKNNFLLKEVYFEEILRLWGIKFKTSNFHQFCEISNISWTEILLWLVFSKNREEKTLILSGKNFSGTL